MYWNVHGVLNHGLLCTALDRSRCIELFVTSKGRSRQASRHGAHLIKHVQFDNIPTIPSTSFLLIATFSGRVVFIALAWALNGASVVSSRSFSYMASSAIPTRLIYCVDGTYCKPDGTNSQGNGNISNTCRVFASIKRGPCFDEDTGEEFYQEKYYEPGIGSADDLSLFDKAIAGEYILKASFSTSCMFLKDYILHQIILTQRLTQLSPCSDGFTSYKAMLTAHVTQGHKAKDSSRLYEVSTRHVASSEKQTMSGYLDSAEELTSYEQ